MASAHTYFVPTRDQCFGELGDSPEVIGALRALWERLAKERALSAAPGATAQGEGDEGEPSGPRSLPVDGVSAWLDGGGALQVRFVWQGVSEDVLDPGLLGVVRGAIEKARAPG